MIKNCPIFVAVNLMRHKTLNAAVEEASCLTDECAFFSEHIEECIVQQIHNLISVIE
jgi:hypothetical protein